MRKTVICLFFSHLMNNKFQILFSVLFVINFHSLLLAQQQYRITYGDTKSDGIYDIIQTTDGGYITAGYFSLASNTYMSSVKYDASFVLQWSFKIKALNGPDYARQILQTSNGGYIIGGYNNGTGGFPSSCCPSDGWPDPYFIKISNSGTLEWTRSLDLNGSGNNLGYGVGITTDGGYIITGYTENGCAGHAVMLVKVNVSGTYQWRTVNGGCGNQDRGYGIIVETDGTYTIAGRTSNFGQGNGDVYLMRTNNLGNISWGKTLGGAQVDEARSIAKTTDGGYVVAGFTASYGYTAGANDNNVYIAKYDNVGTKQWTTVLSGTNTDEAYSIIQTQDGGYVAAGMTLSFGDSKSDFYVTKVDNSGTFQWARTVGGTLGEEAYSIIENTNGSGQLIVAGFTRSWGLGDATYSDALIVSFSSDGSPYGTFGTASATSAAYGGGTTGTGGTTQALPSVNNGTIGSGGTGGAITSSAFDYPLPIELLSFSGKYFLEGKVILKWTTSSESNNEYFSIDRSYDGKKFEVSGNILGTGNSSTKRSYEFIDYPDLNKLTSSTIYYRLKQTDFNGGFSYSSVVQVLINEKSDFSVFSNPILQNLIIAFPESYYDTLLHLKIFDITGKLLYSESVVPQEANNKLKIDITGLNRGVYFLSASIEKGVSSVKKFIKLE